MKKIIGKISVFFAAFACLFAINTAYGADFAVLYEKSESEQIANGVTHEKASKLYTTGWYDINALIVDTTQTSASFSVLETTSEYGLKATVSNLAKANGAIAAVNADFFGSGTAQTSMGNEVESGHTKAATNYYNFNDNVYAGFYFDKYNTPFIDYLKTSLGFYSPSGSLELQGKNKVTNFSKPVYFDRYAMTTTANLDKRFSNLYKIVVNNGFISDISAAGATVTIPENGYIIVMNAATAMEKLSNYSVGQSVRFVEDTKFKFRPDKPIEDVDLGVSGGGEILRNGQYVSEGFIIGEKARHPRTCIGVNADKTKVYIVTIDGRGTSIGATHYEASQILLDYGIYDAIHYDGGGSTTMVVRGEGDSYISLVNTPSEGTQRAVANALGIKNPPSDGIPAQIKVYPVTEDEDNVILATVPVRFDVQCFDKYHNAVTGDVTNRVVFDNSGVDGTWSGNVFTPSEAGTLTVTAKLDDYTYTTECIVRSAPNHATAYAQKPNLVAGESTFLVFETINIDGYKTTPDFTHVLWSLNDPSLGYVQGGKFYATSDGTATVTGIYGGMTTTLTITIGKQATYVTGFENGPINMYMSYFPDNTGVTGGGAVTGAYAAEGTKSLLLNYSFNGNYTQTQAAYIVIDNNPIVLPGTPTDIGMYVRGDENGNLFRIEIGDAKGNRYVLPMIDSMTSAEWTYCSAPIPTNVVYPIKINKFYTASLETTLPEKGTIFIDNITVLSAPTQPAKVEESFKDYKNAYLANAPAAGEEDITLFGNTGTATYSFLSSLSMKMQGNSNKRVYSGNTDIPAYYVPSFKWANKYNVDETTNFSIVHLATGSGNMRTANPDQWRWLQGYLKDMSRKNVIIYMDKNIWNKNYRLNDTRENTALNDVLSKAVAEYGKNILVVSACGNSDTVNVVNGVRYITLSGAASAGNYHYLRVRGDANDMKYSLENIF